MLLYSFFFFFQAEDGIRYHCVTGVQTCALPISLRSMQLRGFSRDKTEAPARRRTLENPRSCMDLSVAEGWVFAKAVGSRSEERRVGKECRSRWSPYH